MPTTAPAPPPQSLASLLAAHPEALSAHAQATEALLNIRALQEDLVAHNRYLHPTRLLLGAITVAVLFAMTAVLSIAFLAHPPSLRMFWDPPPPTWFLISNGCIGVFGAASVASMTVKLRRTMRDIRLVQETLASRASDLRELLQAPSRSDSVPLS